MNERVLPKRAGTRWGRVAHAYFGELPTQAVCGAWVDDPFGFRHASGDVRYDYWGADGDSCRKCLRKLRATSNQDTDPAKEPKESA